MKAVKMTYAEWNARIEAEIENDEMTYEDETALLVERVIDGTPFITADLTTVAKTAKTAVKRLCKALTAEGYDGEYMFDEIIEMISNGVYKYGQCDGSAFWFEVECTMPEYDTWYVTFTFMI